MKFIFLCLLYLLSACSTASTDPTPVWSLSNRFSVEFTNSCNTVQHSLGLTGCVFQGKKLYGDITLPALWTGSLNFISSYCKNIQTPAYAQTDTVLQIQDIYTSTIGTSCSFQVNRTITDNKITFDNVMIGRVFIKIIPDSPYYQPLKMTIGKNQFTGVSWYAKRTDQYEVSNDAVMQVYPTGNTGNLLVKCGEEVIKSIDYTSKPVTLALESDKSCDFELFATNRDVSVINLGTYMHEVSFATISLTNPSVTVKNKNITFTFNDLDISGKKPVVVGVKIDNFPACVKTNKCSTINNRDLYTVRAITSSGRFFFGKFKPSLNRWEVEE